MKTEQLIQEAILAGIEVQNYLWGDDNLNKFDYKSQKDVWVSVFQKRVIKISEINFNHPSYKTELRKRLLQQAALSIQALKIIDEQIDFPNLTD